MLPLALMYPVSFAVSINAARDDLRSLLMPVNRKYPLKEVVAAMRRIPLQSGRKVTAEYVLLAGVNDSAEDALALSRLFRGARIKVNLIPFNPHEASPYRAPEAEVVDPVPERSRSREGSRRSPGSGGAPISAPRAGSCVVQQNTARREGPAESPQEGGRPTPECSALPGVPPP